MENEAEQMENEVEKTENEDAAVMAIGKMTADDELAEWTVRGRPRPMSVQGDKKNEITMMDRMESLPGMMMNLGKQNDEGKMIWDLTRRDRREQAMQMIYDKQVCLLIGNSNNWGSNAGVMEFCLELYRIRMSNGLYFVHEHPKDAGPIEHESVRCWLQNERAWITRGNDPKIRK